MVGGEGEAAADDGTSVIEGTVRKLVEVGVHCAEEVGGHLVPLFGMNILWHEKRGLSPPSGQFADCTCETTISNATTCDGNFERSRASNS